MDGCFRSGFLVFLLMQRCRCEGLSTSSQSLSVGSLQDAHVPEVPPDDVPPVVAPPSLKEVQQDMREASKKVEGHAAEDVLKELLEKVAEATMGQVEAKGGEAAPREAEGVKAGVTGAEKEEAEVLEQALEEEGVGAAALGKEQVGAEVDAFKGPAEEGKRAVKEKGVTTAGPAEEARAGVETGGRDGAEVIGKSPDSREERVAALEETGGDVTAHGAKVEGNNEQVWKERGAAETEAAEPEEPLPSVKVALEKGPEGVGRSDPGLAVAGVEQQGAIGEKEGALVGKTQVDDTKVDIAVPPSDRYDTEATNAAAEDLVEEEKKAAAEGGVAGDGGAGGTDVAAATGAEGHGDDKPMVGEGERRADEEAHLTLEISHGTKTGETMVMSSPRSENGAEASAEQSREEQAATPSSPSGGVDAGEHPLHHDKSDHGNEIITPTDDLLPHAPAAARPTLDNFVTDARVQRPPSGGWTDELVEDTAGNKERSELGLDACKIGAIAAAAFLMVETALVVFYIAKCRKKNGTSALQRACEEGRVEPEEATGGDCSDDTLPADNEQIATLGSPDEAPTPTRGRGQRRADLTSGSREESGPEPASSQDLRTSTL